MTWAVVKNYATIADMKSRGEKPTTIVGTPLVAGIGDKGDKGEKGDRGSDGFGIGGGDGKDGRDGKDAPIPADGKDGVSVVGPSGKDGLSIIGPKGKDGETIVGPRGSDGVSAQPIQLSCVIREEAGDRVRYFAYKYANEDNTAWVNLQKITTNGACVNPIDLRGV